MWLSLNAMQNYSYDRTAAVPGMVLIGVLQDGVDDVSRMPHRVGELASEVERQQRGLDRSDPRAKILDEMKKELVQIEDSMWKASRALKKSISDLQRAQRA